MEPGRVIEDGFMVQQIAGRGGMSTVWRALDRSTGLPVAIKVVSHQFETPDRRFELEVQALLSLQHPAVVKYVAHAALASPPYLAMEWLDGPTLSDRLAAGTLSVEETLVLGARVAHGLAAAHSLGITHRDIKPPNLLLVDGRVDGTKILDFGVVRMSVDQGVTGTGMGVGTPEYMSPEQARGDKDVGPAADVFALGCVLYRCLTGRAAFQRAQPGRVGVVLVIYIDGIVVHGHHIIAAVGVDEAGDKHMLGLALVASENAQVVKDLLRRLIERGLDASLSYLFVIDGGKALRSAIDEMFGERAKVQRCRTHKLRNVLERLPKTEAAQTKAVMMAAYKLEPKKGMAKMNKQAEWLEREHADAAASLREGMHETFTGNALGLPPTLMRCLCTTNIIENPNGIVRRTSRRVTRYRDADMALRWTAAGFIEAQKSFRKIQGIKDLWILKAALKRPDKQAHVDEAKLAA